jgi:hypothetical protein
MIVKHINLGLFSLHQRLLEKLAEKWGMDVSNAIRQCIIKAAEAEGIKR